MKGIIYKATNTDNGKVYIGQTVQSLSHRREEHYKDAECGDVNYFHTALRESEFTWEVIDEFEGGDEYVIHCLNVAEEYQILKHRSNEQKYGYNSTMGGYSSDKFSEHIKKRMRDNSGAVRILQYGLDGVYIDSYDSLSAVGAKFNVPKLKREQLLKSSWRGYMWRIDNDGTKAMFIEPYSPNTGHTPRVYVNVYSTATGSLVDSHLTADEASEKYGRSKDGILASSKRNIGDHYTVQEANLQPYMFIREYNAPKSIVVDVIKKMEVKRGEATAKKAVDQYDVYGNYIASYESISKASSISGKSASIIRCSCNRKGIYNTRENDGVYIWRWGGESLPEIVLHRKSDKIKRPAKIHEIRQYSLDKTYLANYGNIRLASEATGESAALINACIRGRVSPRNKYLWSRGDFNAEWIYSKGKIKGRIVRQYSLDGELMAEYGNVRLASEATGEKPATINASLYGRTPKRSPYIWKRDSI